MSLNFYKKIALRLTSYHNPVSWMLLITLGGVCIFSLVQGAELNWAGGAWRPSLNNHGMPERDFSNLWAAGYLVRLGRVDWVYSTQLFQAWKLGIFGSPLGSQDYLYPPTVFLASVPLSLLPLLPAFFLWNLGNLILAALLLRWARLSWPIVFYGLLNPASWVSIILGQFGPIMAALLIASLLSAPAKPIRAGIMVGLMSMKPQLAVIVPIAWFAQRFWCAILAAMATLIIIAVIIDFTVGSHAWILFFTHSRLVTRAVLEAAPTQAYIDTGVSVFWLCRTLGAGVAFSYAAQSISALVFGALVYIAWRKPQVNERARVAFTACAGLMVVPYGYSCDMVAYSIALGIIVSLNNWRLRLVDMFLWIAPFYSVMLTTLYGILFMPFFIAMACYLAWRQMEDGLGVAARHAEKTQISA